MMPTRVPAEDEIRRAIARSKETKIRVTFTIDADVIRWARGEGINLSGLINDMLHSARRASEQQPQMPSSPQVED